MGGDHSELDHSVALSQRQGVLFVSSSEVVDVHLPSYFNMKHINCENLVDYITGRLNSSITIIIAKLFFIPRKFLVLNRTNLMVTISVLQISG